MTGRHIRKVNMGY